MDPSAAPLTRREALRRAGALFFGASLLAGEAARAANDELAFAAGSLEGVLAALGGQPADGAQVAIAAPDLVENGALVPVEVTSALPGPQEIYVISESNPFPLVARFAVPEGTEAFVSTRIKVAATCSLYAVIRSGARLYWTSKRTEITVGGCA